MKYCFVKEDLEIPCDDNFLGLQAMYAKYIGKFYCYDMASDTLYDQENNIIKKTTDTLMLRTTADKLSHIMGALGDKKIKLFENSEDVQKIEHWYKMNISERKMISVTIDEMLNNNLSMLLTDFCEDEFLFVKSLSKGFSMKVSLNSLLNKEPNVMEILLKFPGRYIISKYLEIDEDSLGTKESRHVVIDNNILNSSRYIHTLKHKVPNSMIRYANEIVEKIKSVDSFPTNYVLDIGKIKGEGKQYDVIEINPISSSMCYINNSIFKEAVPEIELLQKKLGFGNEFLFDYSSNPNKYHKERISNYNYSYNRNDKF